MTNPISTRAYLPQDLEATIDIFLRAIREVAAKDYSPAKIEAWAQVNDLVAWGEHRLSRPTWVAEYSYDHGNNYNNNNQSHQQVVGFADLTADGCLDMMFIHPEFQGRGIASRLLALVEDEAAKLGLSRIYTEASLTARLFFERRGFMVVKQQQVELRGQILINFVMEKYYNQISHG